MISSLNQYFSEQILFWLEQSSIIIIYIYWYDIYISEYEMHDRISTE